jgi:carbamoyl-phosphate synthase small subunit
MTPAQYLQRENTVAIANIDTRKLTRILRSKGAQNGCILALAQGEEITPALIEKAVAEARKAPSMAGLDLAKTGHGREELRLGPDRMAAGHPATVAWEQPKHHVVAFDYGVKKNILRMLAERGCRVTVVPAKTPRRRSEEAQSGRRVPVQRPRRPGALRLRHRVPPAS